MLKCFTKYKTMLLSCFFNDYSSKISEAKQKKFHGEGIKILTLKKTLQRLLIALAQVKAGNTSENLLNEICQFIYFFVSSERNQ